MARKARAKDTDSSWLPAWDHLGSRQLVAVLALAFVLGFTVYAPSHTGAFTNWDDNKLVLENTSVYSLSASNILDIFTPRPGTTYQPLRVLSYAVNWALHGDSPLGYHLLNVLLHVLATVVLYLFILALLERRRGKQAQNSLTALLVALLFLLHPVNVESVAWISSRKYGLLALFTFASLWLYQLAHMRDSQRFLLVSLACAWAAVLSSPFGVTIPPLLALTDGYCQSRDYAKALLGRLPTYAGFCSVGLAVIPLLLNVRQSGDIAEIAKAHHENQLTTLLSTINGVADYATNLVAPFWLNCRYPNEIVFAINGSIVLVILGSLAALIGSILAARRGFPLGLFCLGWIGVTWGPIAQLVPTSTIVADRYLYLTGVGLFLFVATASERFLARYSWSRALVLALLLAASLLTFERAKVWRSSVDLWADSVAKSPLNYLALNSYGQALRKVDRLDEAEKQFWEAVKVAPDYGRAHHSLGDVLLNVRDKPKEALKHFMIYLDDQDRQQIPRHKRNPLAYMNVAIIHARAGDMSKAREYFAIAYEIEPTNGEVNHNLAVLYTMQRAFPLAKKHYEAAIVNEPKNAQVFLDYINTLKQMQETETIPRVVALGIQTFPDSPRLQQLR